MDLSKVCSFSRIGQAVFCRAQFFGNSSTHANGKRAQKSSVIHEWTFLEAMRFGFAENADRSGSRIVVSPNFANGNIGESVILGDGESGRFTVRVEILFVTEECTNATMVGIARLVVSVVSTRARHVWRGSKRGRSKRSLLQGAIGVS